jgi:Fe-S-cluster containining protein
MHENVNVFVDQGGEWTIEFFTPCKHLLPDNHCGDYENRPRICREYPADHETCEFENDDPPYKHLFTNAQEFEEYLLQRKKEWRWKTTVR